MDSTLIIDTRVEADPLVSFLVPVYNEKDSVLAVLKALALFPKSHEIILVDDGSTDGTRNVLRGVTDLGIAIYFHAQNGGKGAAIRTAAEFVRGRYIAIQDADLEYDPSEYLGHLTVARRDRMPAVFGSRFLTENPSLYRRFRWGNILMTEWINFLSGGKFTDCYTGSKMIETSLFKNLNLKSSGFEMEAEICVKLLHRGVKPVEVPIRYRPRSLADGKKIGWKDFFLGLRATYHYHFHPY